jgi:hypothetical protein
VLLLDADGENERGTVRVIPSARLDPCPSVCDGGGCADINEVEDAAAVAVADPDVDEDPDSDLPCRTSESVIIGTADAAAVTAPFRTLFTAGGSGVGTGCGCCE